MDRNVILKAYFNSRALVEEQIRSYNLFLDTIQNIIDENKYIDPKVSDFTIKLGKIEVGTPHTIEADGLKKPILPWEARLRGRSYLAPIHLEMTPLHRGIEGNTEKLYVGQIPVLVKSKLCHLENLTPEELISVGEDPADPGGYFITNGTERFIGNREETATSKLLVKEILNGFKGSYQTHTGSFKAKVNITREKSGALRVGFPNVVKAKLINVLMALGMDSHDKIRVAFKNSDEVQNDLLINFEESEVTNEEEALKYLGHFVAPNQPIEYKLRRSQEVLDQFLLPNLGTDPDARMAKAKALIRMAEKVIDCSYGLRPIDDLDNYANKRIITTGPMMEQLFRQAFKRFINDIRKNAERTVTRRRKLRLKTLVQPEMLTQSIIVAINTGVWNPQTKGVTRALTRTNFVSPLIDFKRINSSLSTMRASMEARQLHGTHWGKVCCIQTPDDENVGLTKNLSTLGIITIDESEEYVKDVLEKNKLLKI
ncbi:MAG: DNA-directed RNA polymerase subunit B'' [Candidatus Diapherotrites archaeon]|nr:DNA-directed RNA polymerase subunit B'' [Candidatus Diapherotrites archaeon]